jgi:hypothetical protein
MRLVALVTITSSLLTACAASRSSTARPATPKAEHELPTVCSETARPLDAAGTALLTDLQHHLVSNVLSDAAPADELFNTSDLQGLIREYPDAEMAFIFPISIRLPASTFHLRSAADRTELKNANHVVFYLELSKVGMVAKGGDIGLTLYYDAGPTRARPAHGSAWDMWGEFCVVRDANGGWSAFSTGLVFVS